MSCPDWQALARSRRDTEASSPSREGEARLWDSEWQESIQHLGACSECRSEALAADPLLIFRDLPAADLSADETDEMRRRVAGLRRTRAIESSDPRSWPRWIAAAVLLVAVLGGTLGLTIKGGSPVQETLADEGSSQAAEVLSAQLGGRAVPDAAALAAKRSPLDDLEGDHLALPLFEEMGEPYQQVVQWSDESMSVVLVVDARFDV